MLTVHSPSETLRVITEIFSDFSIEKEIIDLKDSLSRIVFEDILSDHNVPPYKRSTVDGYAVSSFETFGSSNSMPSEFRIIGEVLMGVKTNISINTSEAVYVPTGGEIPAGADCVIMVEYTECADENTLFVYKPAAPQTNIINTGDDFQKNQCIIKANTVISSIHCGLLAAAGINKLAVKKKLLFSILVTGDEIISPGKILQTGQIYDSNGYYLNSWIQEVGGVCVLHKIISDDFDELKAAFTDALLKSDIVLITGGSSAGIKDQTKNVINSLGRPGVIVHGISIKPGKPTIIGVINNKPIIGLPGNPVSVASITTYFLNHLVAVMTGNHKSLKTVVGKMSCNYGSNSGRAEIVPVLLEYCADGIKIKPLLLRSFQLYTLSTAQGYIYISEDKEGLLVDETVEVILGYM